MKIASARNTLKNIYSDPTDLNTHELIEYLDSVAGVELKLPCIRQNLFKIKWIKRDITLRNRCQVQAAVLYLKSISPINSDHKVANLKTVIADICPYINVLDPIEDTSFIKISTNTLPSTIHYKHAEWLFYKNDLRPDEKNRFGLDILVLYALRLSLEKRILGFLGIDFIEIDDKPSSLSKLVKVIKILKEVRYHKDISWEQIEWVNNWLNHHMHRHLRPHPWSIHQAFEVLNPLLQPSTVVDGITTHHSFYASTFVIDEDVFQTEIEKQILTVIPKAKITWKKNREIAKRNK